MVASTSGWRRRAIRSPSSSRMWAASCGTPTCCTAVSPSARSMTSRWISKDCSRSSQAGHLRDREDPQGREVRHQPIRAAGRPIHRRDAAGRDGGVSWAGDTVEGSTSVDLSEAIHGVVDVLHQAAGTIARVDKAIQRIDETVLSRQSLEHIDSSLANIDMATSNAVALTLSLRERRRREPWQGGQYVDEILGRCRQSQSDFQEHRSVVTANQDDIRTATKKLAESAERLNDILAHLEKGEGTAGKLLVDPTLHDEIVHLVQNWRKYGLLYKEGNQAERESLRNRSAGPCHSLRGLLKAGAGRSFSARTPRQPAR